MLPEHCLLPGGGGGGGGGGEEKKEKKVGKKFKKLTCLVLMIYSFLV